MTTVYLDYNSTTPLAKSVQEVIKQSLSDHWANPSSNSTLGQKAKQQIENARKSVATMIGAKAENIIFTSGGTESNNMAICSSVTWAKQVGCAKPHVVISNVEHVATTEPLKRLATMDEIEYTEVAVDRHGLLHTEDIISGIRPSTCLISIMLANNETGVIFPVEDIASFMGLVLVHYTAEILVRLLCTQLFKVVVRREDTDLVQKIHQ